MPRAQAANISSVCVATPGRWRKKLGEEKIYKYFTVARRSISGCSAYEPMGDPGNTLGI
jgi:hypothetical protein